MQLSVSGGIEEVALYVYISISNWEGISIGTLAIGAYLSQPMAVGEDRDSLLLLA